MVAEQKKFTETIEKELRILADVHDLVRLLLNHQPMLLGTTESASFEILEFMLLPCHRQLIVPVHHLCSDDGSSIEMVRKQEDFGVRTWGG